MDHLFQKLHYRQHRYSRIIGLQHLILFLMVIGLIAATVNIYSVTQARINVWVTSSGIEIYNKSQLYYISHFVQILFLISAGFLGLLVKAKRKGTLEHVPIFLLYLFVILIMTLRGYTSNDIFTKEIVSAYGPFPLIISVIAYFSAFKGDLIFLKRFFVYVGIFSTIMICYEISNVNFIARDSFNKHLWAYMQVQLWVAAWFILIPKYNTFKYKYLTWVPLIIYFIASILMQGRTRFIWISIILIFYLYVTKKRGKELTKKIYFIFLVIILMLSVLSSGFFYETGLGQKISITTIQFQDRLYEDTRSQQYTDFFQQIQISDLIFGKGAKASWSWGLNERRYGLDNGYLGLLFRGGIPLLVTYFLFHFLPAIRYLKSNNYGYESVCAFLVILWGCKLFTSSIPVLSLDYYLILFCVGVCIGPPTELRRNCVHYYDKKIPHIW